MDALINQYILNLVGQQSDHVFASMEKEAQESCVPIMERDGIEFLKQLIRLHQPARILEIGTAIGYSALQMADANKQAEIVTIERDEERFQRAVDYVGQFDVDQQIDLLFGDAFEHQELLINKGPYDMIFIDAAKGQYQRFFETFAVALGEKGVIITDNVLFKGYVVDDGAASKRLKKLSEKIDRYNQWLMHLEQYHTVIVPVGDGVAITCKTKGV